MLQVADGLMIDVQLRSAPGASAFAGVGYLHALGEEAGHEVLIDCHDDAGLVMAALRAGCRLLVFNGPDETYQRLADMAAYHGATLDHETKDISTCLALSPNDDAGTIRDRLTSFASNERLEKAPPGKKPHTIG